MDTKRDYGITYDEANYINEVSGEYLTEGRIVSKCPRCGGALLYEDYGSGYVIRCEKDRCIRVTFRGI